ncbi:PAS domain S-box protein [Terrimonas sp. NA20]|uniref:histidine kinase n=1 Tax=Terrimonas ginsenosidimutans TaxID=2908004 RepID=A0ABS9KSB5_9BACT|nr:PAS domain S-box protein [Terrimonas ginsenosidimutans]MCG2615204.1 PAS domain S-box protein [Terrimonas ginsenosidimutans]
MKSFKLLLITADHLPYTAGIRESISQIAPDCSIMAFGQFAGLGETVMRQGIGAVIYPFDLEKQLKDALQKARVEQPELLLITVINPSTDPALLNDTFSDSFVFADQTDRLGFALTSASVNRRAGTLASGLEARLQEAEQIVHNIFHQHPLPKWIYDFNTLRFLEVNEAAVAHYGYSRKEFLEMTITEIRPEEDVAQLAADLLRVKTEPDVRKGQFRHRKKNGEIIFVETTAYFAPGQGKDARMVVVRDVSDAVRIAKEKEFASKNLAALINNTDDLIWSVDAELKLISCNTAFERFFNKLNGHSPVNGEDVLTPSLGESIAKVFRSNYNRALSGESFSVVTRLGKPVARWAEMSFYPIYSEDRIIGTACFSRDISSQRKAEQSLRRLERNLNYEKVQAQKKVTLAILEGQERERNHIGRELHDNINQILASAKLRLSTIGKSEQSVAEQLKDPMELIDSAVREIRALTRGYVAPLKSYSLKEMIQYLLDTVHATTSIKASFEYSLKTENFNNDLKLNLYRIVQEQLNNILKYAEAKTIKIHIGKYYKFISIVISDDGKGFDPSAKRAGIGFSNMTNRVELFNGELSIESHPGHGCKMHIVIPATAENSPEVETVTS